MSVTWATLVEMLARMFLGKDKESLTAASGFDTKERDCRRADETSALESVYPSATANVVHESTDDTVINTTYLKIPIPDTPLVLHIILPENHPYPFSSSLPPMYITSTSTSPGSSVAPYVRLHLLSMTLNSPSILQRGDGEGMGLLAAGILEEEWAKIVAEGPPDVSEVLKPLLASDTKEIPQDEALSTEDITVSRETSQRTPQKKGGAFLDDRSDATILSDFEKTKQSHDYIRLLADRQKLPAWNSRSEFLNSFKNSRVVVCVGETGSGKTTQIPQYILDEFLQNPSSSSPRTLQIVVTQPRRVAAVSVASRVTAERGNDRSVAYTIRGESTATRRTKLLFCTTGVVLRRLTVGDGLKGVNVIVVDEVSHHWTLYASQFVEVSC